MNRTSERLAADATSALTSDIIPFWLRYGIDSEHGGIWTALDQTGRIIERDKSGWFQGRALWTFSRCITDLAAGEADRTTWFAAAAQIHEFLETSCRRDDGRYYFRVTRDGRPLIMRRYIFTEAFAALPRQRGVFRSGSTDGSSRVVTYRVEISSADDGEDR